MARINHPRANPISIIKNNNIFVGYSVDLNDEDVVTANWLVPDPDGTLRRSTIDVDVPAAIAAASAVFNASKGDVE